MQLRRSSRERFESHLKEKRKAPVEGPSESEIDEYGKETKALIDLMDESDFRWMLEGGRVLPLFIGRYLRQHADFDIGVFSDDLECFEEHLHARDYALFYRNYYLSQIEDTRFDLYQKTNPSLIRKKKVKRLYALPVESDGKINLKRGDIEVDIHVYKECEKGVLNGAQHLLPTDWFASRVVETLHGNLPLGDLRVLYYHKLGGQRPRHRFDRKIIESYGLIPEDEISRIRELRRKNDGNLG